ncbi:hypothetical protein ATANTOWER_016145, partial [Ataeniobius toweri]|nr:hypothetical protein [Ataeniobius toweri]
MMDLRKFCTFCRIKSSVVSKNCTGKVKKLAHQTAVSFPSCCSAVRKMLETVRGCSRSG